MKANRKSWLSLMFLSVMALSVPAFGDTTYITPQLRCAWRQERARIQTDIDYSNFLLGIHCDPDFNALVRQRFSQLDQDSLASYNRGFFPMTPAPAAPPRPRAR
jgi:hypothetical protein